MGRLIPITAKAVDGQEFARPRVVYVNDDLIKVVPFGPDGASKLTKVIEEGANGSKDVYQCYTKALVIEALRNPSSTDVVIKQVIALAAAALGTNQATGLAITKAVTEITTATAATADGVSLPAATVGAEFIIINNHASVLVEIFPQPTEFINNLDVGIQFITALNSRTHLVCTVAGRWVTALDNGR